METSFHESMTTEVVQWACSMESYRDGGYHFHLCILLNKIQRWLNVKNAIKEHFGIVVKFAGHSGYQTAYKYVTMENREFFTSPNHPAYAVAPKTLCASRATSQKSKGKSKKEQIKQSSSVSHFGKKMHGGSGPKWKC